MAALLFLAHSPSPLSGWSTARLSAHGARGWLARGVWGHSPRKHQERMSLGLRAPQGLRWKVSFRTCRELWPQTGGGNEVCRDRLSFHIRHPLVPAPRPQSAVSRFHTLFDFAWPGTERFAAGPLSRPFSGSFLLVQDPGQACGRTGSHSVAVPVSTRPLTGNILGILDPEGTGIKRGLN